MLAFASESDNINYNVISEGISEFIRCFESFEWFEGLFINMSNVTGLIVNLVYDGNKLDNKLINLTGAFFELVSYEAGVFISLNKIDVNSYTDSSFDMLDFIRLKSGKIIRDNNGTISNLKSIINQEEEDEDQDDILPGIQYVK